MIGKKHRYVFSTSFQCLYFTNNQLFTQQKNSWQKRAGHPEKIQGKAAL